MLFDDTERIATPSTAGSQRHRPKHQAAPNYVGNGLGNDFVVILDEQGPMVGRYSSLGEQFE